MKFFWVSNEWSPAFVDTIEWFNKLVGNREKALVYAGWFDKFAHFILHHWLVLIPSLFGFPIWLMLLISEFFGLVIWEGIVDCNIFKSGASKLDLVSNNLGMLSSYTLLLLVHNLNPLVTLKFWF